jgi:gluconolactonase
VLIGAATVDVPTATGRDPTDLLHIDVQEIPAAVCSYRFADRRMFAPVTSRSAAGRSRGAAVSGGYAVRRFRYGVGFPGEHGAGGVLRVQRAVSEPTPNASVGWGTICVLPVGVTSGIPPSAVESVQLGAAGSPIEMRYMNVGHVRCGPVANGAPVSAGPRFAAMRTKIQLMLILILLLSACGGTAPKAESRTGTSTAGTGAIGTSTPSTAENATTGTSADSTAATGTSTPGASTSGTGSNATGNASNPLTARGEVELVAEGYGFTEGPQWMPKEKLWLFTDQPDHSIFQVAANNKVTIFRKPSNNANGLAVDQQGRLLAAEADARRVTRTERDGTVKPIATQFEGHRLNQPNDIVVRSDGTIYFTDPAFENAVPPNELDFRGIFRISPGGKLIAERRGALSEAPNGVALSPDEHRLYVSDYANFRVWVFDVARDGSLSEARSFIHVDSPDGMAVDAAGNLYVASENGIAVFAADGTLWGVITVPRVPSNCAFGGPDGRTLYITAREGVYQLRLAHPGHY